MYKPGLSEANFTSEYLKAIKEKGGWGFKIPDIARTIKPFDMFYIDEKGVHFVETKKISKREFRFSQLRDNQYTALKRILSLIEKFSFRNIFSEVLLYEEDTGFYTLVNFQKVLHEEKIGGDRIIL